MVELGWSNAELSRRTGVAEGVISRFLKKEKRTKQIGIESIQRILEVLGLLGGISVIRRHGPIPVISWVQAGQWTEAMDPYPAGVSGEEEPVYSNTPVGHYAFALRVEGESMAPEARPGDIVIIDPEKHCENGSLCVVKLNDEVSFKKVLFENEGSVVRLVPLNPRYPETVVRSDMKVDLQLIGKAVDLIRRL